MKSYIFQITNSKIWRISALKVYLKLNHKVVLITLSTHGKPSLNMQKQSGQIVLCLDIFNFKTFRAEILQIFELVIYLENWWLHKFILTLSDLYQSARFRKEQQKEILLAIQGPIEGLGIYILFWSETRKFKCSQGRVHVLK